MKCCVLSCKNYSDRRSDDMIGITFHVFPTDKYAKQLWQLKINRKNWILTKHTKICSNHFKKEDIVRTKNGAHKIKLGRYPLLNLDDAKDTNSTEPVICQAPDPSSLNEFLSFNETQKERELKNNITQLQLKAKSDQLRIRLLKAKIIRLERELADSKNICGISEATGEAINCTTSSTKNNSEDPAIISNVYSYLQEEYKFLEIDNLNSCDLIPLSDIAKRTADALGVSKKTVWAVMKEKKKMKRRNKFIPMTTTLANEMRNDSVDTFADNAVQVELNSTKLDQPIEAVFIRENKLDDSCPNENNPIYSPEIFTHCKRSVVKQKPEIERVTSNDQEIITVIKIEEEEEEEEDVIYDVLVKEL